jgi:hypothetical protein
MERGGWFAAKGLGSNAASEMFMERLWNEYWQITWLWIWMSRNEISIMVGYGSKHGWIEFGYGIPWCNGAGQGVLDYGERM